MPSFDIISEVNTVELRNAIDNSVRELSTRFDFRGVEAEIKLDQEIVKLTAENDFQVDQLITIVRGNLAKRNVDPRSIDSQATSRSGKHFHKDLVFKQGIDTPTAKKIVKLIKDNKMKVQASIQGDKVRVTGKKRDDLQTVIAFLRGNEDIELPLQFENFRD
ncbi:YajQ family cyclic di-GMP-binding protein [Thaumasiovibrio subtropicus]|uniref:YajQ family cyclic di-GMP-binding protein n=1 Tax=Thaumasiovibrio subtropicus TaxID=1891207 RepID=UPI000B358CA7|nr:YajQ family cyclic di-GMP-binding protein [Thaumasiovibrio subtropicus]